MQVTRFLHKFVSNTLPKIHKTRLNALTCTVSSLLDQGKLTLTALGRNMSGSALVKHKIKRVDRLLGNRKLLGDRFYIYKQLSSKILNNLTEVVIIVDWSGCCSQQRWILQASVAMSGRSIPIYKELHPLSLISNPKVERKFLERLHDIIPRHLKVIVVTDAGFKSPWFKVVNSLGWDYVGRLRSRVQLSFYDGAWHKIADFIGKIPNKPVFLGQAMLGRARALMQSNIYAFQSKHLGRKKKRRKYYNDGYPDKNMKYGRANREPWILATSLPGHIKLARKVVNIYRVRMQIEQNFRDVKNQRWGFGLRDSRTENIQRLEILLIIAFIATIILWLLGMDAESKGMHYGFQANTKRKQRTLSLFSLGWQVLKHGVRGMYPSLNRALQQIEPCYLKEIS